VIINDRVYGEQNIDDSLILELINSPELERLKGIGQYGTWHIIDKSLDTTRFEHSLGVYLLLRRFGAGFDEQIAGLLHDVNHATFSHVIDYVFGDPATQTLGDSKHHDIISRSSIPSLLKKKGIDVKKVIDVHSFGLLERETPDICCDRLDYCLRDGVCCKIINQKEAKKILDGIIINNGELVCKNKEIALMLGRLSIKMTRHLWSNEVQAGSYHIFAEALKLAVKEAILKEEDFYKMSDNELINLLINSGNKKIVEILGLIRKEAIAIGTKEDNDFYCKSKVRYMDPKFINGDKLIIASRRDKRFKKEIQDMKQWITKGFYIKLKQ
jgi:hypothetical protein